MSRAGSPSKAKQGPKASAAPRPAPAAPKANALTSGNLPPWMHAFSKYRGYIAPIGFILLMVVLLVPLPPMVMDLLICLNIALSVVILLTCIYMDQPLDFSVFPSLLLATTLFRLVLNVASTRLILTADADSPEAAAAVAGHVIMAFGDFVAGGSLFVGVVIFLILVIVQFMVITKGATRISEVAARFTLDAMPGKQMAIDSDLNAGIIDEAEARFRRGRITQEADFFGAMDGASKFVRGDAVAGLIITVVNVIGGFAVGVVSRGWDAGKTAEVFTKLTIGDGISSQIPSFLIAIGSALIVTRSGAKEQLGDQMADQIMSQPRGLYITAAFMLVLSVTPLPTIPLLAGAALLAGVAYALTAATKQDEDDVVEQARVAAAPPSTPEPPSVESLLKVDTMELEVGYGLVALVDKNQGGDLLDRISAVRRQLAVELGLVMPPVRIRDNMALPSNDYRVKIRNNVVASGSLRPGKLLAMDSGLASGRIDGERTKEPAFGLDAYWIEPTMKTRAETMNYTVVDPTSVLGTHLTELIRKHGDELLTRDEVNNLLEQLKQKAPKLVEDVVPSIVKPIDLQRILQNLLRERVPVRDLETILETLADWGTKTKDIDVLTEYVRNALRRTICHIHAQPNGPDPQNLKLLCVTLDPTLEDLINSYVDRGAAGTSINMPSRMAARIAEQTSQALQSVTSQGFPAVVVASPTVRAVVRQILEPHIPGIVVLGYNEIVTGVEVESAALVMTPDMGALRSQPEPAAA